MRWHKKELVVQTPGQGMHDITAAVQSEIAAAGIVEGMCFLFVRHTSASLVLSENWDPSARLDIQEFMDRLVPENQAWMRHTDEGRDDSPSHMKTILTNSSESIPIEEGKLYLGTWQGIFLFEHRQRPHRRQVVLRFLDAG